MRPVLYDFKRTFFRLSVILFLVIFAAIGLAVSYEVHHFLAGQLNYYTVGVAYFGNKVYGIVLGSNGNPISGGKVYLNIPGSPILYTNSSGEFEYTLNSTLPYVTVFFKNYTLLVHEEEISIKPSSYVYSPISGVSFGKNISIKALAVNKYSNGTAKILVISSTPGNLSYSYDSKTEYVGFLKAPISTFNVFVDNSNSTTIFYEVGNEKIPLALQLITPIAQILSIGQLFSSITLFSIFFPVIFLYLAYEIFSKPRSVGALEFVLSKPVTRGELYFNRFLGGVLTALVASIIFILVIDVGMQLLEDVSFGTTGTLLLIADYAISLISFYSLLFLVISYVKEHGTFLGIGIAIFLLFDFFWGLIALAISTEVHNRMVMSYIDLLNPLGSGSFLQTLFLKELNISLPTTIPQLPLYVYVITAIVWMIVPVMLGYLKFRKTDL